MTVSFDIDDVLASGGDERIILDANGLNRYHYGVTPRPLDLALSSTTASTISAPAYEHVRGYFDRLVSATKTQDMSEIYADEMQRLGTEIRTLYGWEAEDVDLVFGASGTDIHLFTALLQAGNSDRPALAITVEGSETGSGVGMAMKGCHFMGLTSGGAQVVAGQPVNLGTGIQSVCVPARTSEGGLRKDSEVEADIRTLVTAAHSEGRKTLLIVTDVSKTGLICPEWSVVERLRSQFGPALEIFVDACQFRLSRESIRAYIAQGYPVAVTGSKFFAGPAFSGLLICPKSVARRWRHHRFPIEIKNYARQAEWPDSWSVSATLPKTANLGLLLRWEAAMFQMKAFSNLSSERLLTCVRGFSDALDARLKGEPHFQKLATRAIRRPTSQHADLWDQSPTIFPLVLCSKDQNRLSVAQTLEIYQNLASGTKVGPAIRLGQAVSFTGMGGFSALRLGLSAPLLVEAATRTDGLSHLIGQGMAALDALVDQIDALSSQTSKPMPRRA